MIVERDAARTKHLHQFEQFIKTKPNTTTTTIYKKCVWIFFVHEPTTTTYLVCIHMHFKNTHLKLTKIIDSNGKKIPN